MANWIQNLLDMGIGELATKMLYYMRIGAERSPVCGKCLYIVQKFAEQCPKCREELPWVITYEWNRDEF